MAIILHYQCRRCEERFFDPTITYLQKVEQIQGTPSLMTTIHQCSDVNRDGSKRFGICDLIGCKVTK